MARCESAFTLFTSRCRPAMSDLRCVGALIRDPMNRVYAHRRSPNRRLLPGIWDIVGGHIESGESAEQALAREIEEETGWRLRTIEAVVADWEWEHAGVVRHEVDYLVQVDGDLATPRLEAGKHDAYAWIGPDDLELMMAGRVDGDRRLRDVVACAVRLRLTERLRLVPIGARHADELVRLHGDAGIAEWYGGTWTPEYARKRAAAMGRAWDDDGAAMWLAYDRASGAVVGRGGLARHPADADVTDRIAGLVGRSWERDRLDVGWAIVHARWGRGYATEIGRAGLRFAFEDLGAERVTAITERHNARSRAVMERLGMRYAGEVVTEGLVEGRGGIHPDAPFAVYVADSVGG